MTYARRLSQWAGPASAVALVMVLLATLAMASHARIASARTATTAATWRYYGASIHPKAVLDGVTCRGSCWQHASFTRVLDADLAAIKGAGGNTVRAVDFLQGTSDPYNATIWANMDYLTRHAAPQGMGVILDLSTYRNLLLKLHGAAYAYDPAHWTAFVAFVAHRYAGHVGIAYVAFAGELEAPNGSSSKRQPMSVYLSFFRSVQAQYHAIDPAHRLAVGGLLQLSWNSGIDWRALFGLPFNSIATVHDYNTPDRTVSDPMVAAWAHAHGRRFVIEEFGFTQTMRDKATPLQCVSIASADERRACAYANEYNLARSLGADGVLFWNYGPEVVGISGVTATYDTNPQTPATWATVVANATK